MHGARHYLRVPSHEWLFMRLPMGPAAMMPPTLTHLFRLLDRALARFVEKPRVMRLHVGVSPRVRLVRQIWREQVGPLWHYPERELVPPVEWVPSFHLKSPFRML